MKDEKKAPKLRFKGFTDDWEQCKLGDVAKITMGQSPNSNNYTSNPKDYILVVDCIINLNTTENQ